MDAAVPSISEGHFPDITELHSWFPIHTACLSIIEHVVSLKPQTQPGKASTGLAAIQEFYQALYSLREDIQEDPEGITGKGVEWEHGYYGARRFWFDSWSMERGWEFLCADPIEIPDLTDYLLSNLRTISVPPQAEPTGGSQQGSDSPKAALDTLPVELLDRITSYLPCPTILHLHQTNRALSARIALGPSFWRDQLISGNFLSFIWDLDAAK